MPPINNVPSNGWLLRNDISPLAEKLSYEIRGTLYVVLDNNYDLYYITTQVARHERLVESWENGNGYCYIENKRL